MAGTPSAPDSQRAIHIQLDAKDVLSRPRWNELAVEAIPTGSKLVQITTTSTSRWWK